MRPKFPSHIMIFEIDHIIPKGTMDYALNFHSVEIRLLLWAPINLKAHDCLWINMQNGHVEIVERAGIAIWRDAWLN
jgi:hypothetical protein